MGQEFHVVRCFSCQSFQVHQVKKVNKWTCKLCGEKQTLQKEFGRGSGADCRRHVQKLNAMRGAMIEEQEHKTWSLWEQAEEEEEEEEEEPEGEQQVTQPQVSRWTKYLDTPQEAEPDNEDEGNVLMERKHYHGNHMTDRKRKRDGGRDSYTPEQHRPGLIKPPQPTRTTSLNQTSLNQTRPTSLNQTRPTSLNQTRPTSLNQTSLNQTRTRGLDKTSHNRSRPSPNTVVNPPSVSSGPVSRWACFLSSDSQVKERAEPLVDGRSHWPRESSTLTCNDVITQPPPPSRPRPLHSTSSMFESGEEFNFDDLNY